MKAVLIRRHGGPEVLEIADLPRPEAGAGQVVLQVKAAGMNHLDTWVRRGIPGMTHPLPMVPGSDAAGIVVAVGPGVIGPKAGDRVFVSPGYSCGRCAACFAGDEPLCKDYGMIGEHASGTQAELVALPAGNVLPLPDGLSFEEGAAFPLVFLTAWRMVVSKARVLPGEAVLILGIGGGVALAALQIAKHAGARVFVTSSSQEKLDRAKAMGADVLINHKATDFSKEVWGITEKRGVDVVIENVGAATWAGSIRALARGGRLVTCGATSGPKPDEDIRRIFTKQITIYGSTMGTRHDWEQLNRLLAAKTFRPVVDRTFPLEQAAQAQTLLEHGEHFGKLVLTIPPLS